MSSPISTPTVPENSPDAFPMLSPLLVTLPAFGQAPLEAAASISEQLVARVKASLERRTAKEAEFTGEGAWDEEDSELLEEEIAPEEEVMEHFVDSLGYLLKGHGPAYLAIFDRVTAPVFAPLLANSQPTSLRCAAVFVGDNSAWPRVG